MSENKFIHKSKYQFQCMSSKGRDDAAMSKQLTQDLKYDLVFYSESSEIIQHISPIEKYILIKAIYIIILLYSELK